MVFTTTTAKKKKKKKNSRLIRPYPSFKFLYFFAHRDSRTFNYHQNFTILFFCCKFKLIIYPFPKSFYCESFHLSDLTDPRFIISLPRIVNNPGWKNFLDLFLFFIQSTRDIVTRLLLSPTLKWHEYKTKRCGTQSKIPHVQLNPFVHRRSPPPVFPRFMSMTSVSRSLQTHSSPSRHARWILIGQHGKDLSPLLGRMPK